jgi:type IV pilus assembly protein PilF
MSHLMRNATAIVVLSLSQACVTTSRVPDPPPEEAAAANLNLGIAYLRQSRPELALEKLERALEYNPRLAAAHSTIAIVFEQLADPEAAEEHYLRATQLGPDDGSAANSYAVFLCRRNRWQEAERFFRRAADNPRYLTPAAALTNAGVCARAADDTVTAERYFREALTRNPIFPDALYHLANLSYREQDYLQARAFMQRYLGNTASSPEMLLLCVQIEKALGGDNDAQACAQNLRSRFPNSAEVAQLNALERDD